MAHIVPFKAVRPTADKVHLVASRSYVTYKPADLKRKLSENPFTFIHIINPEFGQPKKSKPNTRQRFAKVRARYEEFLEAGIFEQDQEDAYYIYRQTTPDASFTGVICGVSIEEYEQGKIKIHEHTLTKREEVFCEYLDTCDFNAEPVLLTYRENNVEAKTMIGAETANRPAYDFTTTDYIRHQLWVITRPSSIETLTQSFAHIGQLYIADGHHRMASSAKLGLRRRADNPDDKDAPHNFALAMLIPDELLQIEPFHRLISVGAAMGDDEILKNLERDFAVTKSPEAVIPDEKRLWGMRLSSGWYALKLKIPHRTESKSGQLDATILTEHILRPIFGIEDEKTDKRIQFIPGNEPIAPVASAIDKGIATALFTLHRVDSEELFAVADAGEVMPPKSTWIAPKLRSGLTIMPLS